MSKKKATVKTILPTSDSPMDVRLLEQIVKMMAVNDLNAVELRDGEKRITLKRGPAGHTGPIYHTVAPAAPTHAPVAPAAAAAATPVVDEDAGLTPIKSPMVGTFYAAGSPEAKAFVQVGSTVDEETDVCIIEAMKVFNNIKAETRGTIAKILVTNGQTVEFGQVLFFGQAMSTAVQRRNLDYADIDAAIADVQSLRRGYTKSGNWDLPQICWHLTNVLDRTSRPATEPATPEHVKMQPIKQQILATGRLPGRIEAPAPVVPPENCGEESIDAFIAALRRLAVYPENSAVHRLWGPLTVEEFHRLSLIHCAHHLSHLTANS